MQIRDEHELKRNITLALQKAHFGDYEIAIRLLIDIIEYQQKQISNLNKDSVEIDKRFIELKVQPLRPMTMDQLGNDPLDKGKKYINEKYGENNDKT